jgi:hypothetical protein
MSVGLRMKNMLPAIELNHELSLRATKVDDESPYRMLTTKLDAVQMAIAQVSPQDAFGVGLTTAKISCTRCSGEGSRRHSARSSLPRHSPSPFPSPRGGEG